VLLLYKITFAVPGQDDFYHKYFKIESKGLNGKVLTRSAKTGFLIRPSLDEHVSLNSAYTGFNNQKWIIAPIASGSNEFYIICKETGYPLMIEGDVLKCNTSGITNDRQRFKFKNINGDYLQIQSAVTPGCFYRKIHKRYNGLGQETGSCYYSLCYSSDPNVNDDYSYFKLTAVEDITGSDKVSASDLIHQPDMLFAAPEPPQLISYTGSAPLYLNETIIGESWVPFTLIRDIAYSPTGQISQTPFYKFVRKQAWKKIADYSYEPVGTYTTTCRHYKGISSSENYMAQITVGHGWSPEGTAEFQDPALEASLGASYSDKLSTPVTLVNEYTKDTWQELSEKLVVRTQASIRIVVYQLVDRYSINRMNGSEVISPIEYFNSKYYKYKTWSSRPITITRNPSSGEIIIADDYSPQNFSVTAKNNHPYLQWNAAALPGLSYYEIWKKKNGAWALLESTTGTEYTCKNESIIAAGSYVYFKVRAVDNTGQKSGFTNEVRFSVSGGLQKENSGSADSLKIRNVSAVLQLQNYPNPFNPSTRIRFNLPEADNVLLRVFDISGQLVATLVDGYLQEGNHDVIFNAQQFSSGIYIYKITTSKTSVAKRMLLLK
jgi:hypothetical protein